MEAAPGGFIPGLLQVVSLTLQWISEQFLGGYHILVQPRQSLLVVDLIVVTPSATQRTQTAVLLQHPKPDLRHKRSQYTENRENQPKKLVFRSLTLKNNNFSTKITYLGGKNKNVTNI